MHKFIFGTYIYEYQLIKQNRKTLSLTVTPELQIVVKCPQQADLVRIEKFLQRKWFWLEKQLSFFRKYQRKVYKKEYVSGESYLYLGRQYKLVVRRAKKDFVSLTHGQLLVSTTRGIANGLYNKKLIKVWFDDKIAIVFLQRLNEICLKFRYDKTPKLSIREMKTRWGSYLGNNRIGLNPKLIHISKDCIDYVISHELCHIKYKNHDQKFYRLLSQKYPSWKKTKEKLEVTGSYID